MLAALLAALGTAVLGQLAVVSGRRRRREFAILKALGLLRRQIREITAWQVTIWAGLALLIGVPLGLAAGRWSWQLFGTGLGIPADARVPVTLVLVMVPAVLVIAKGAALWPGHSAAGSSRPARCALSKPEASRGQRGGVSTTAAVVLTAPDCTREHPVIARPRSVRSRVRARSAGGEAGADST